MAFNQIIKGKTPPRIVATQITMSARLHDGKTSRHVAIRLPVELMTKLGWTPNHRIHVHEGVRDDAGRIMLVLAESDETGYTAYKTSPTSSSLWLKIFSERFKSYTLNECPVDSAPVNYSINDDAIIIEIPDWLRYITPLPEQQNA